MISVWLPDIMSYGTGGKGNVGEFLSIKSINKDMTGEYYDGEMELVSEVEVHEVTFSTGVQQRLAGVCVWLAHLGLTGRRVDGEDLFRSLFITTGLALIPDKNV